MSRLLFYSVLAIALWFRLDFVLGVDVPLHSDMASFDARAMSILQHGQFAVGGDQIGFAASTYRPPFYPLFLAGIYAIFGHSQLPVYIIQALLGTLTVALTYWLAHNMLDNTPVWIREAAALSAMGLVATYPSIVAYSGILLSETLFITLLMTALLGIFRLTQPGAKKFTAILTGMVLGLSGLTRTVGLPVSLIALLIFLIARRVSWTSAILVVVTALLMIAPWTLRNYAEFGRYVFVDNAAGINMVIGNNDLAKGDYTQGYAETWLYKNALSNSKNIVEFDHNLMANARQWIASHPQRYAQLVLKRLGNYFVGQHEFYAEQYHWQRIPGFHHENNQWLRIVLQGLAIFGLLCAIWHRNVHAVVLGLSAAYFYIFPAFCLYHTRYRSPGVPLVFILGAATFWLIVMQAGKVFKKA